MTQHMKTRRMELKSLSQGFKILVKKGTIHSINAGLISHYAKQGHTTLHSYRKWRQLGFQVKRGSKALMLWGEPKLRKQEEHSEENKKSFFPVAYVFSNLQVEPNAHVAR
jgi:hypothetical protein